MNRIFLKTTPLLSVLFIFLFVFKTNAQNSDKKRLFVITDIGNEPDDMMSMVRLMLYANQIDIEGLVASTSIHQQDLVQTQLIEKAILAYGKVRTNLLKHEAGFPETQQLLSLAKKGIPKYGMLGLDKGQDSEGSEWLIKMLEKNDPRPLYVSVWGGANVLAQALWKLKDTKTEADLQKLIAKLRVYTISDQDDTGFWIRKTFKDLFFVVSPGTYQSATWSAITGEMQGANNEVVSNDWIAKNIQQGHGPLGEIYPDVAFGMEGDTPSYLSVIPNGINEPEHPNWGAWGGRYELYTPEFDPKVKWIFPLEAETRPIWTNAIDEFSPRIDAKYGRATKYDTVKVKNNHVTLWRWRTDFQNDFAARMDWCLTDYKNANHPPVAKLGTPNAITVKSGEKYSLDGRLSYDPDGDALSFHWFQYLEAGTLKEKQNISPADNISVIPHMVAPKVSSPQTLHFILKVTDKGTPKLSRYQRLIVNVIP
jgi:Protein of unknown function (DUF1593)